MRKFLIIQTAFIGDAVLATALIEKLHVFYPDAEIDFLVRKGNEDLFLHHPFLNRLLVWNKKAKKYANLFKILKEIRRRKYDYVVNVQRFAATGFLTVFSGAVKTVGFDKNPWSFAFSKKVKHVMNSPQHYLHEVERNQLLIQDITDKSAAKPRLYPSLNDYEKVTFYQNNPYICLAPASVWFTKQYPAQKWINLINKLPLHFNIYLLGGPEDTELCNKITAGCKGNTAMSLAGKLTFLQSAALQQQAVMNYVNDSAPMHLASSVNAPVTAVYCSTVPYFGFGPLSDNSSIIQTKEPLACKPCGLHGYQACPLGHFKCAITIDDEQFLEPIKEHLC